MAQAFAEGFEQRLANGYPPSVVADHVVKGILEKRFYIVPAQPEVKAGVDLRAQDIMQLQNPTLSRIRQ